jgi:uncharacterized membrane protein AbrB (regulator of aidB expression)
VLTSIDGLNAYLATASKATDSVATITLGSRADASLGLVVQMQRLFLGVLAGALLSRWSLYVSMRFREALAE